MFCKLFAKEEPKPKVNYGKIIAISVTVVLAVAAAAFAVFKYLEKKKYDEYLDELCDCDCDCDCDGCDDEDCDCCDCCGDDTVEVDTEEAAEA